MSKVLIRIRKIPLGFYSQIFSLLLSLPTLVIITRFLEIEEYGRYSLLQRIAFCIGVIGSFGIFTSVAHLPEEYRRLRTTVKNLTLVVILIAQLLMVYLISLVIHLDKPSTHSVLVLVLSNIPIMYFLNLFRGEGRELDFLICKVTIPAVYLMVLLYLSMNSDKLNASLLITIMAFVQMGVVCILIMLERRYKRFRSQTDKRSPGIFLKHSQSIWIPGIFVEARNFLEPMIVNEHASAKVFGAYSFSLTVSSLPIFIGVYYSTFLPSKFKSNNDDPKILLKKILRQSSTFSFVLAGITSIPVLVLFNFLPNTYAENALTSTLFYLAIAPLVAINVIFLQYYLIQKRTIVNLASVTFYVLAIALGMSIVRPVSSTQIVSIIAVTSLAILIFNLYCFSRSDLFAIPEKQREEEI